MSTRSRAIGESSRSSSRSSDRSPTRPRKACRPKACRSAGLATCSPTPRRNGPKSVYRALLIAAIALIGAGAARADDLVHVGKAQATAWTFLPVDIGIAQGLFAKQGLTIESADLAGDAKVQQALVAGSIDFGLGSGPGMAFAAKGSPAIGVAAFAGAPRNISAIVLADSPIKTDRRSQGQDDRRLDGGLAQRLAGQADGDPGRLGPGRHPRRAAGRDPDQRRRAQGQAGRCRGAGDRSRLRARRAQRRPRAGVDGSLRAAFHHPCGVRAKVPRRGQRPRWWSVSSKASLPRSLS